MPCTIIMLSVQPLLRIILLAVILCKAATLPSSLVKTTTEGIVMVRFLNSTAELRTTRLFPSMVLQVIVVLLVRKRNIPLFRKKKPANTVFIDPLQQYSRNRIARTICLLYIMCRLMSSGIAMLYETAGSKSDARWQI